MTRVKAGNRTSFLCIAIKLRNIFSLHIGFCYICNIYRHVNMITTWTIRHRHFPKRRFPKIRFRTDGFSLPTPYREKRFNKFLIATTSVEKTKTVKKQNAWKQCKYFHFKKRRLNVGLFVGLSEDPCIIN